MSGMGDISRELARALLAEDMPEVRKLEYKMGNGQCDVCYGANPNDPGWFNHPCYPKRESLGHKDGCLLAKKLAGAGFDVVYRSKSYWD